MNTMQTAYYKSLDTYEDLEAHKAFVLGHVTEKDKSLVEEAIRIVEEQHDTPRTLYKGNYNRHPVRVARILIEEFGVKDTNTVLIALCHDLGEWSDYDVENLVREFGVSVKAGVDVLTWDQSSDWEAFFQGIISTGDNDLILIKLADKLDNNRAAAFAIDEAEKVKARTKTQTVVLPFVNKQFPEYWSKFAESVSYNS